MGGGAWRLQCRFWRFWDVSNWFHWTWFQIDCSTARESPPNVIFNDLVTNDLSSCYQLEACAMWKPQFLYFIVFCIFILYLWGELWKVAEREMWGCWGKGAADLADGEPEPPWYSVHTMLKSQLLLMKREVRAPKENENTVVKKMTCLDCDFDQRLVKKWRQSLCWATKSLRTHQNHFAHKSPSIGTQITAAAFFSPFLLNVKVFLLWIFFIFSEQYCSQALILFLFYIIIGSRSNLWRPVPFLKPLWNWSYSFKLFQHKKVFVLCFPKMTSNIQPQNIFYHLVFPLRIWHFYLILFNVNFICN